MRIFIAGLFTETNTRSSAPTDLASFHEGIFSEGRASREPARAHTEPLILWRGLAEAEGHEVVEGLFAYATPGGRVVQPVHEQLRDRIVDEARRAGPLDLVLLHLHGAMAAEGVDDCEGDLFSRLRDALGRKVFLAAELDLHAHLTEAMLRASDLLISYKEYPHTDVRERAHELYDIATAAVRGEVRPVASVFDCRTIHLWRTADQPTRGFVDWLSALEGEAGVLSVSFIHGFPHADVADVGAKMLVVTDDRRRDGDALARRLGLELHHMTTGMAPLSVPADEALEAALGSGARPALVADVADNAGGGAPSDSTFLLRRLLERGVQDVAMGYFVDPAALQACRAAGEGARVTLDLGGKAGAASGAPVRLEATVRALADEHFQTSPTGAASPLGAAVWIEAEGRVDLVLVERRQQVLGPDGFEALGVDLQGKRLIVVKSGNHFRRNFERLGTTVFYADTPGACTLDIAGLAFSKRRTPYWPKVRAPFAADASADGGKGDP